MKPFSIVGIKVCLLLAAGLVLVAGCDRPDAGTSYEDGEFAASVTLCRKIGSKTGKRIGVGDSFAIKKKSSVQGLADFEGVEPGHDYGIHLVWIAPDGDEVFRRYAEVRCSEVDGGYETLIRWKKGDDLHYLKADTLTSDTPRFTLKSRFRISPEKNREPGQYALQVYLHRQLLLESRFDVRAS